VLAIRILVNYGRRQLSVLLNYGFVRLRWLRRPPFIRLAWSCVLLSWIILLMHSPSAGCHSRPSLSIRLQPRSPFCRLLL